MKLLHLLWRIPAALLILAVGIGYAQESETGVLKEHPNTPANAKNVIMMISDGCGYNHITAASYYRTGLADGFVFHKFPVQVGMSTHPIGKEYDPNKAWTDLNYVKDDYTDSAAAATALSCGYKTYNGAIGLVGDDDNHAVRAKNVIEYAEDNGKMTGVVTSVPLSHATPAGFVAHNKSRNKYDEIAREMIMESAVDVIMGCGCPYHDDDGQYEDSGSFKYVGDEETWVELVDGTITTADADGDGQPDPWHLAQTVAEFNEIATQKNPPKRVIGVPLIHSTLQSKRSGSGDHPFDSERNDEVPTLAEMTKAALNVLSQDEDGFFVMVEGGAVDWASHDNKSGRMIEEELEFVNAIEAVVNWVDTHSNWDETLLVITADHECGFLTGPADEGPVEEILTLKNNGKLSIPDLKWRSGSHTNSLVPLFAQGPPSALELITKMADEKDPVRGAYVDNTEIGQLLIDAVR